MSILETGEQLRDFYDPNDFSDQEVAEELARIEGCLSVEREWLRVSGLEPYADESAIAQAREIDELTLVTPRIGFMPIWRLRTMADGYSEPFLRPVAYDVLQKVGRIWSNERGTDNNGIWHLSVTSMVRSTEYQMKISSIDRKPAADPRSGNHSAHEYGVAFDIDAGGLYLDGENGLNAIHPRIDHDHSEILKEARGVLREILGMYATKREISFVEELPNTLQWCFHVCVNPVR